MSAQTLTLPKLELELSKQQINSLVQQYLQQCYKSEDIKDRAMSLIQQKVDKEVARLINNGVLINRIASRIAKEIPLSDILSLIDTEELNKVIQKRIADSIISKLGSTINNK